MNSTRKWIIIGLGVLILMLAWIIFIWIAVPLLNPTIPSSSSNAINLPIINEITCDATEHLNNHIHAHLDIFINRHPILVHSDIGIVPDRCLYWLHTHDDKGIIHIESPDKRNFTLGEFFDVWNQEFSNSQIFDNRIEENDNKTLDVYVNGDKVSAGTDYRQIPINAHDEIAIVYGKPPDPLPSEYNFPTGL
jgi:hypothetical protein